MLCSSHLWWARNVLGRQAEAEFQRERDREVSVMRRHNAYSLNVA